MTYHAKTMFTGYKLGLKKADLYVGIPTKFWNRDTIEVEYKGETRTFKKDDVKTEQTFNDKFRPGETYTLAYVVWEKVSSEPLML